MAESNVPVTSGSGNNIDTFTLASTANKRQSVVVGDSSIDLNVAPVQSTDPASSTQGLVVRDVNTSAIVAKIPSTGQKVMASSLPVVVSSDQSTITVSFDPGHTLGSLIANQSVNLNQYGGIGTTLGSKVSASSVPVVVASDQGTLSVQFSPSTPAVLANTSATIVIPLVASGTASGVSTSGNTIISPVVGRNLKIYAYALTTTAVTSAVARFTNGAGVSPTEFWRLALQSASGVASGANLAIQPPGYLFATGTGNTLAILLDSGIVFHYSVGYFEESA